VVAAFVRAQASSVLESDHLPAGGVNDRCVMCCHDNSGAGVTDLLQQFDDLCGCSRVEVPGRFVSAQDSGPDCESACDRSTLPFAA
jgi:hypothetical protein